MSDLESTQNVEEKKHDMPMPGWWRERSLAEKILMGIGFGILGIGFLALCGWVLMLLWNWLMPEIFGLKMINYWQSWGLLILSTILFKRMGPGGPRPSSEYRRKKKLKTYIHEEHFNNPDSDE